MKIKPPPYYKVRKGRAYFELGAAADKIGMKRSVALGRDGEAARASGQKLYLEWRDRCGKGDVTKPDREWPAGSLGHFFASLRSRPRYRNLRPATRAEWEHVWTAYLGPAFGARRLDTVNPSEFEDFAEAVERSKGKAARWRMVKIARAMFAAAVKYRVLKASPALTVANSRPAGRSERWSAPEIQRLVESAERIGKHAMALAIRLGWETALSPIDVRALSLSQIKRDGRGAWIETQRAKTGEEVSAAISDGLYRDLLAYIEAVGLDPLPSAPILRTSRDARGYIKVRFVADFDLVRKSAFGNDERRRFQDIRRSANLEAAIGGATPEQRAEMLANSLHKDAELERTYTPATVERSRKMAEIRLQGRQWLAGQTVNLACLDGKKL